MAEPQSDQYDTIIALEFARRHGYTRKEVGSDPTFFDGKVAIRKDSALSDQYSLCIPASPDHPNIKRACDLIRLWPKVFIQCQFLIESVSVFIDTQASCDAEQGSIYNIGSICSSGTHGFGTIASTINSHVGFAEAIVHEMAHHKLRALGVEFESAERIIRNPIGQKFKSPIKLDCLRPMSAVLHAQYSYTYVSALDIEIITAGKAAERDRCIAEVSLAKNLPKLEFGLKVIEDNAEVDHAGADFLEGYFNWLDYVLEAGYQILDEFGISPQVFVHPLETHDDCGDSTDLLQDGHTVPCRLSSIEEHDLGDEMLLYSLDKEIGISLNSSAKAIWELCNGKRTVDEISEELSLSLDLSSADLLPEVKAAITQLSKFGLLKLAGGSRERGI
ncbi:MAG: PqqD family peptide modification chaperone [Symploca sp. SIO2D2]|nr:PqqD family peptide modification chaperone [Symploca sp. SIO2D2]